MAGRTVWYPGHMASGERELSKLADKLDVLIEVRDARAPGLTSSPVIKRLSKIRPVAVVLSKKDLASEEGTAAWLKYFAASGTNAWAFNMRNAKLEPMLKTLNKTRPPHRELRLAVVGIPNVGKSFFLNLLVGKTAAKVGGIPGITRGVSWYKGNGLLVVDSPGILDPHSGEETQRRLSWLGCTKAEVIGGYESMGTHLINFLRKTNLLSILEKWNISTYSDRKEEYEAQEILAQIGRRLGCLVSGGNIDMELAGRKLVESFSTGKLGSVTIEYPDGGN
ncbi:MAG: 50S ribosome-binding GTPase [Synergistaceae bacterium]|nr:50S ribosome-binding GTPase [Synergistaceae bacterium]